MDNPSKSLIKYIYKDKYSKFKYILDKLDCSKEEKIRIIHTKYNNTLYDTFLISLLQKRYKFIEKLLKNGANVNEEYEKNWTPVMIAINNKNFDILKLLISHGGSIHSKNINGTTPLMLSIRTNNIEIYNYLIDLGANINEFDNNNNNNMMIASKYASLEFLRIILDKLPNKIYYLSYRNVYGNYALLCALLDKRIEIALELLNYEFNIDMQNLEGENALMLSCKLNYNDVVKRLVDKKCKLNYKNLYDNTALMYAIHNNNNDNIKLLIENNCRTDLKNINGCNSLLLACFKNNIHAVKLILNKYIKLNTSDNSGKTALLLACENKNPLLIEILLEHNKKVDEILHNDIWNSFIVTIKNNDIESFKMILKYSKNLDKNHVNRVSSQKTLLMYASQYGCLEIVKMILQYDININLVCYNLSALDYALTKSHRKIANLLIMHKNFEFTEIQTLEFAIKHNNEEIVKILINKLLDNDNYIYYNKNKLVECSMINDNVNIMKILLDKFDYNTNNIKYSLQKAVLLKSDKCFNYLINLEICTKIDLNYKNKEGDTLFMLASYKLYPKLIKLLISKNINIFMKNKLNEDIYLFFGKNCIEFNKMTNDNKFNYIKNVIRSNNWFRRKNYVMLFYSLYHNIKIENNTTILRFKNITKISNVFGDINLFRYIGSFI